MSENTTLTENTKQGFPLSPPLKRKVPQDSFRSYIDQVQNGYTGSKLIRNSPRKTSDTYFIIKTRATLYRTKREGSTRENIAFMTCSFLELDGANDNTLKTQGDVQDLINKNSLPMPSYVIETSRGHFHLIWNYSRPLPWNERNESYWISQQTRLIELFKRAGFNVDTGASLNPVQNLRNASQLKPYNFKRRCKVFIHKSYRKTSLRTLYKALNATNIQNPRPIPASVKLRRYSRANRTFTGTHAELAIRLGFSPRTSKREIKKAIANGDIKIIARLGNNSEKTRTTQYESLIFIEQFPEVPLSINTNNSFKRTDLLSGFQANGAEKGRRNRTLFALGLYLKAQLGKRASIGAIRAELLQGAMACHVREKEFEGILKNVMKDSYTNPLSMSKLREWGLLQETMCNSKYHDIPLH